MTTAVEATFPAAFSVLFEPRRYKVFYGGRGGARSWSLSRGLLLLATGHVPERHTSPIRVLCARELQKSIDDSVHKLLADQISNLGMNYLFEVQRNKIFTRSGVFPAGRSEFGFEGIRHNVKEIKSYEGADYCWIEEGVAVSESSMNIITATIRKETPWNWRDLGLAKPQFVSEIWVSFNPEFEDDYMFATMVKPGTTEMVAVVRTSWQDNPWFPEVLRQEMNRDRVLLDPDRFANKWEGECIRALEGTVYAKELRRAFAEGRVTKVPYDRSVPVDTFWDLGRANSTAIWFAQSVGMQFRILSYYENSLEDISHYIAELQHRGYAYGTCYLPHDAASLRLGMPRTIERTMRDAGFRVRIVPKLSITDGINAAKMVMGGCWFDDKGCADGLNALKHYRYKLDSDRRLSGEAPIHDWSSDGADAFRMLAVVIRPPERRPAGFLSGLLGGEGFTGPQRERAAEVARGGAAGRSGWMGR